MFLFIKKLFKKNNNQAKDIIEKISKISILTDEISNKNKELLSIQSDIYLKNKKDLYISLNDIIEIINSNSTDLNDIIKKCKHISEINSVVSSYIDVHAIVENNHVVLCPDISTCSIHNKYSGSKLRIASVKIK